MIFKREHAPSEDQLNTLRRGEEWNEEVAKRLKEERERKAKEESEYAKSRKRKENFVPNSYYKDKYQHLIGKEAALEAARKTEANSSYGCGGYNININTQVTLNFYCRHKLFVIIVFLRLYNNIHKSFFSRTGCNVSYFSFFSLHVRKKKRKDIMQEVQLKRRGHVYSKDYETCCHKVR